MSKTGAPPVPSRAFFGRRKGHKLRPLRAALFETLLPRASRLYLTEVDAAPEGDAWFPEINESDWREVSAEPHPAGEKDDHAFVFRVLERAV